MHILITNANAMKQIQYTSEVKVYEGFEEMDLKDVQLIKLAIDQLPLAYAPYSNFHVGAALRLSDGQIFTGVNQENASYPLCMCGERNALYSAGNTNPKVPVESLAIVARNMNKKTETPVTPCGACRQVICEYEHRHSSDIKIFLKGFDGSQVYEFTSGKDLLPFLFNPSFL